MLDVLEIAHDWSYWDSAPETGIARDVVLPNELSPRVAFVVKGVRRCGKSTLLAQLIDRYRLERKHCLFINFEDPRLANALHYKTLEAAVASFRKLRGGQHLLTFFFDEIQWVQGWQKWLRARLDRPQKCCFVVTGSNANLLAGELGSSLTGRHLSIELFPFSFTETRKLIKRANLESFLTHGGFPEVLKSSDGPSLLRQYFHDIVERDVRERVAARSSQALRQLVQMVFESTGSELSVRRIAAAAGIAVETAQGYLEACEAAYLLFSCPYFAFSERKRAAYHRKYYPVDTALRQTAITQIGSDQGKLLECASFVALRRRYDRVSYWRGKGEVDFVVQDNAGRPTPIQVSWNGIEDRHQRALDEFYENFPTATEPMLITRHSYGDLLGA